MLTALPRSSPRGCPTSPPTTFSVSIFPKFILPHMTGKNVYRKTSWFQPGDRRDGQTRGDGDAIRERRRVALVPARARRRGGRYFPRRKRFRSGGSGSSRRRRRLARLTAGIYLSRLPISTPPWCVPAAGRHCGDGVYGGADAGVACFRDVAGNFSPILTPRAPTSPHCSFAALTPAAAPAAIDAVRLVVVRTKPVPPGSGRRRDGGGRGSGSCGPWGSSTKPVTTNTVVVRDVFIWQGGRWTRKGGEQRWWRGRFSCRRHECLRNGGEELRHRHGQVRGSAAAATTTTAIVDVAAPPATSPPTTTARESSGTRRRHANGTRISLISPDLPPDRLGTDAQPVLGVPAGDERPTSGVHGVRLFADSVGDSVSRGGRGCAPPPTATVAAAAATLRSRRRERTDNPRHLYLGPEKSTRAVSVALCYRSAVDFVCRFGAT